VPFEREGDLGGENVKIEDAGGQGGEEREARAGGGGRGGQDLLGVFAVEV
jgi:hypothetical protein